MFPDGYPILQPRVVPLFENGDSQYPDVKPVRGFGRLAKGRDE